MSDIAIIWDFDGTLTPDDSTSKTLEALGKGSPDLFWEQINNLRRSRPQARKVFQPHHDLQRNDLKQEKPQETKWEHILASNAPIWMYTLARIAHQKKVPLNKEFFKKFVVPNIKLYANVIPFLRTIKELEQRKDFQEQNIKIEHFIISAGLKELIEEVIYDQELKSNKNSIDLRKEPLVRWVFGGRYIITYPEEDSKNKPESIPAFCMDETMKTRSVFEIAKGSFTDPNAPVNKRVKTQKYPFSNMVYIGDGPTDIPALALIRDRGGTGILLYDKNMGVEKIKKRLNKMSSDSRANFITETNFSLEGELFEFIKAHCIRVLQLYKARNIESILK